MTNLSIILQLTKDSWNPIELREILLSQKLIGVRIRWSAENATFKTIPNYALYFNYRLGNKSGKIVITYDGGPDLFIVNKINHKQKVSKVNDVYADQLITTIDNLIFN